MVHLATVLQGFAQMSSLCWNTRFVDRTTVKQDQMDSMDGGFVGICRRADADA